VTDSIVEALRAYALGELGFDLFGITTADPLPEGDSLAAWCAAGCAADLPYVRQTASRRGDPRALLTGARSVLCVAMSYHDTADPAPRTGHARVARYARRRDYHDAIRSRLVRLGRRLATLCPGTRWRPAVDSAPLLERALAARAGLGFIGKSTSLIHPRLGPELLLGELVTSAVLATGTPLTTGCGSCTACLGACPTGALTAPFRLDASRCISGWTIERRGALPPEAAGRLQGSLFGCDLCQTACPFQRHAAPACNPVLATRPQLLELPVATLRQLDEAGWRLLAAGTPLRRLDLARMRRNLEALAPTLPTQASDLGPQTSAPQDNQASDLRHDR
jgi:epoxyqueuosine reductase